MKKSLQHLQLVAALSLSLLILTACVTTRSTATIEARTDVACEVFDPIFFSASEDTPETIRQVRGFNAALIELCPEKLPTATQPQPRQGSF